MTDGKDNLRSLYNTLKNEGYNPPEFEQFAKDMEDENNLRGVYSTLQKEGYTPPDFDVFRNDMGFYNTRGANLAAGVDEASARARTAQQPTQRKTRYDVAQEQYEQGRQQTNATPVSQTAMGQMGGYGISPTGIPVRNAQGYPMAHPQPQAPAKPMAPAPRAGQWSGAPTTQVPFAPSEEQGDVRYMPLEQGEDTRQAYADRKQAKRDLWQQQSDNVESLLAASEKRDMEAGTKRTIFTENGSEEVITPKRSNETRELRAAQRALRNTQRIINAADTEAGFGQGLKERVFDLDNWDFGITDITDLNALKRAMDAFDKGEKLTESQQALLDAKALEMAVNVYFASDLSKGYQAGQDIAGSLPFMAEFMLGIGSAASKATSKALVKYFTKRFAKAMENKAVNTAVRGGTRVLSDLERAGLMTVTSGAVGTEADARQRMMGQVRYDEDEQGKVTYAGHTQGEDEWKARRKAATARTLTNFSEMFGEYLGFLGKGGRWLSGTKAGKFFGLDKVAGFIDNVASSEIGSFIGRIESKAHFHGAVGEMAEELFDGVTNATFVGDQTLQDVFGKENLTRTALSVGIMSMFFSGAKLGGYGVAKGFNAADMAVRTRRADRAAANAFGTQWDGVRGQLDGATAEQAADIIQGMYESGNYTGEQLQSALNYAIYKKGNEMIERYKANNQTMQEAAAEQSYNTGYEDATTDELRSGINTAYNDARQKLVGMIGEDNVTVIDEDPLGMQRLYDNDPNVSEEVTWAVAEYVSAKSAVDGMHQRIADDAEDNAEAKRETYRPMMRNDGTIHPVTLNEVGADGQPKTVYLLDGSDVVLNPDGSIDSEKSSPTLTAYDPEQGKNIFIDDPYGDKGIQSVGEVTTPEALDQLASGGVDGQGALNTGGNNGQGARIPMDGQGARAPERTPGAPETYTPGMVMGVVDNAGQEHVAEIVGRVRYDKGQFVPDENGMFVEYTVDGQTKHETADKLNGMVRWHETAAQPQQPITAAEGQQPTAGQTAPQEGVNDASDTRTPAQRTYDNIVAKLGADRASHKIDATAKVKADRLAKAEKALKTAQETADNTEYGSKEEQKAEEAVVKAQAEYEAAQQDMAAWEEVRKLRDQALIAQSVAEDAARKAERDRRLAEESEAQRKQREAYAAEQARRKAEAEAEAAEKRRQEENERLRQQAAEAAANPQPAEPKAPIEGTKGQASQLEIARQELSDDPGALAMLDDMEPRSLEEVAAMLLRSGKNQTRLQREDFMRETGYSANDIKRIPFVFAGAEKGGITLRRLGEAIEAEARNHSITFDESDPNAGRSAALAMLGSVGSQGDINEYITNNRIAQAYDYHNAALAAERANMLEAYGMTEEEYESYMSWLDDAIEQGKSTLSDEEFNQIFDLYGQEQTTDAAGGNQEGAETIERPESAETDVSQNGERGNGETDAGTAEQPQQPAVETAQQPKEEAEGETDTAPQPVGGVPAQGETAQAIAAAEAETDTNPTEGQKEAGNYKKGHVRIDGYDITIEQPKGSVRRGTDKNGRAWEQEMHNTYGYIRGTESVDGDHIDVFLSDDPTQGNVYVVDQVNEEGKFDEHKVMYGFPDMESARQAYLSNYEDGWRGLGTITPVSKEEFKKWIESSHRKTKPFSEYKGVKTEGDVMVGEGIKPAAGQSETWDEHVNKVMEAYDKEYAAIEKSDGERLRKETAGYSDERLLNTYIRNAGISQIFGKGREGMRKFVSEEKNYKADKLDEVKENNLEAAPDAARQSFVQDVLRAELDRRGIEYKEEYTFAETSEAENWYKQNVEGKAGQPRAAVGEGENKEPKESGKNIADVEAGGAIVNKLEQMGVEVSADIAENRRVRKQADNDKSENGKIHELRTTDGKVYGFAYRGKLYLDPRKIDAELPLHEYAHLWTEAMRMLNPKKWAEVVEQIKQDKDAWQFIKSTYPDLKTDSEIADEVIATFSGKNGAEKLKAALDRFTQNNPDYKSRWNAIYNSIAKALQDFWKAVGDFLNIKYESAEQVYDQVLKDFVIGMNPRARVEKYLQERETAYMQAAESGDVAKATEIFNQALSEEIGNGMTPFIAAGRYDRASRIPTLAHKVKSREPNAIDEVAELIAPIIPKNAVLVPAPSHNGRATDMLDLARAIAKRTGSEVADVLTSEPRDSQYETKKRGGLIASQDMGITMTGTLPEGKIPVVIDNVVGSGNTAEACVRAIGKGLVVSLGDAADRYNHAVSLKSAAPILRDRNNNIVPLSKRFELGGSQYLGRSAYERADGKAAKVSVKERKLRDAVVDLLRRAGIEVVTESEEGQRVLDEANGKGVTLNKAQKRILETAPLIQEEGSRADISSIDGAKVLKKLDILAEKLENSSSDRKNFLQEVGNALNAKQYGSKSQYATFETKNGQIVTIRLGNHNATVSSFDNNGEDNGISIVISRRANEGITNDGNAHLVEYFYSDKAINRAEGKPLAEIVRSIKQSLYSGEYKDTTGLAEREEVNAEQVRMHRVYHGSGADFERFDHSHMNEGEGNQSFGWGTYVTEVEGIGRMYADTVRKIKYNGIEMDRFLLDSTIPEGMSNAEISIMRLIAMSLDKGNRDINTIKDRLHDYTERRYQRYLGRKEWTDGDYRKYMGITSAKEIKEQRNEDEHKVQEYEEMIRVVDGIKKEEFEIPDRILYTVEIPEDNGSNYLEWDKPIGAELAKKLQDFAFEQIMNADYRRFYPIGEEQARADLQRVIEPESDMAWVNRALEGRNISAKAISEFLHSAGFVGIKYPADYYNGGRADNAKNYVIFNESDLQITDKVKFFRTESGEAYGFTMGGKIYLDPRIATAETPIHEYTHLWAAALRQANPKAWERLKSELEKDTDLMAYVRGLYPELKGDELMDEVFAHFSGRRGAERMRAEQERMEGETQSLVGKAKVIAMFENLRNALKKFWNAARDLFAGKGLKNESAEDFADMVLADLVSGFNPSTDGDVRFRGEEEPVFYSNAMRAVENIKQERATPEQWVKMIEKQGGLKAGEDKWLGLSEWLKGSDAKTLTKGEVLDYIRANEIQVEEVEYSDARMPNDFAYNLRRELEEKASEICYDVTDEYEDEIAEVEDFSDELDEIEDETINEARRRLDEEFGVSTEHYISIQFETDRRRLVYEPTGSDRDFSNNFAQKVWNQRNGNEDEPINETRLSYTTEGLDNKREIVLTVPAIEPWNEHDEVHFGEAGGGRAVAWVRFGETTDADGKRVLVIDEIQSKRHQEGREKGYSTITDEEKTRLKELKRGNDMKQVISDVADFLHEKGFLNTEKEKEKYFYEDAYLIYNGKYDEFASKYGKEAADMLQSFENGAKKRQQEIEKLEAKQNGIPDAPFEKNWHEVAMKRMLRFAAENGYDKVAWTKGEQQAERYNIGYVISHINIEPLNYKDEDFGYEYAKEIVVYTKDGLNNFAIKATKDGIIRGGDYYYGESLQNVFGKELAEKIMSSEGKTTIENVGLRIGGEGMKDFYDQILPRFMDKYGKKWGVKTGEVRLDGLSGSNGENGVVMHAVDVTEDMRESVMRGQPLFRPKTQSREGGEEANAGEWYDRNSVERIGEFVGYSPKRIAAMNARQEQSARKKFRDAAEKLHLGDRITFVDTIDEIEGIGEEQRKAWRRKKGWYSPRTGKIVIILGNHRSMDDVIKSILHEGVAHHGLRQMFGKHFDTFLDNVYMNASPEIRDRINTMAKRHGWDFRTATEEYLATLAEDTDFEKPENQSWWKQVKAWFFDMLHKIGIKLNDFYDTITDNELRYILWCSYENLVNPGRYNSVVEEAKDIAKQYDLKVGQWDVEWTIEDREPNATTVYNGRIIPVWAGNGRRGNRADREDRNDRMGSEYNVAAEGVAEDAAEFAKHRRTAETIKKRFPEPLTMRNYKSWEVKNYLAHILGMGGWINEIPRRIPYRFLHPEPTLDDYFKDTIATFKSIGKVPEDDTPNKLLAAQRVNMTRWEKMKESGKYEHHQSPLSNSEYLVDRETGDIYRLSDHWGQVASCDWNIDQRHGGERGIMQIGKCNITEFSPKNKNGKNVVINPAYIKVLTEATSVAKENYMTFLDNVEMTDAVRRDVESQITDLEKNLEREIGNFGDSGIRFRDGDFSERDEVTARDYYERMVSSSRYQVREAVQDSMLGLRKAYEAILGGGKKFRIEEVPGNENAYLAENRMSSVNASEQHNYFVECMKPLLEEIHKICGSDKALRQELTDYMMAKHGLERNRVFAERDAQNGQNALNGQGARIPERDYAGLTALTGMADVHDAELAAMQMVADFEARHDVSKLWTATKKATGVTLAKIYLSGMLSKESYEQIRDQFEWYIPLQGFDETTSDEVYGYLTSRQGPYGSPIKHAEGRSSKADDPIATIGMMADMAIRQANRNEMKKLFLNFVLNHPSDLVSVNRLWLQHDDVSGDWMPVFADIEEGDTAADVERKVAAFEQRMEQLAAAEPDKYKHGRNAKNIPYRVLPGNLSEHQVLVKRDGETYVLTINGNPRAAQALNGLTNPDVKVGGVVGDMMKAAEWVNHYLSAAYTTRTPDFVVSNYFRDMLYSNCMTWVKEGRNYALRFHKNFGKFNPATMRVLFGKWEKGTLDESKPIEFMFKQFMLNGGETGYTNVRDIEAHKQEIARELKRQGNVPRKAWHAFGMQLDLVNRSVENCARFAAFITSQELGRSIERSIYDAKEVSVNFNKKGSGGKMVNATGQTGWGKFGSYLSGTGRLLYVFWNAGTQGMTNFMRAAKHHPGKFSAGAAAMFALGAIIPLLAKAIGDDDDDENAYYNLPEYVRRSNICFRFTKEMPWITIPLPIEFRAIYGLGELGTGVITGDEHYSDSELARQLIAQVSQILPLDFMEGQGGLHNLWPSWAKPIVEASSNKRWTGLPIYKDTPFNQKDPEFTKVYKNADKNLVAASKWLNELTGGDDYKKGWADKVNPAQVEYVLNGYLGGWFKVPNQLMKMGETAFGDRDFEWRNMMLANRLIKNGDERTANRKLQNEYFELKDEYEETKRLLKKYKNAANEGVLKYAEKLAFLNESEEYGRYLIFDEDREEIDKLYQQMKEEEGEQRKATEEEYYSVVRKMVDKVHKYNKKQ